MAWLDDLRFGWRAIRGRWRLTSAVVATLGVAVGANGAVFSVLNALWLRPLPFPNADRVVLVRTRVAGALGNVSLREYRAIIGETRAFDDTAAYYRNQYNIAEDGLPEAVPATIGTHNLFRVLGVPPIAGATWPAATDFTRQYQVVIGHRLWQQRFGGDPAVVGRRIRLDVSDYTIVGVAPPGADYPLRTDVFRAISDFTAQDQRRLTIVARLPASGGLDRARTELARLSDDLAVRYPATNPGVTFDVQLLRDAYVGGARRYAWLLAAVLGVVLVGACANVSNLLLARVMERDGELAVRQALGAGRGRVIRQLAFETALLTVAGGVAGAAALVPAQQLLLVVIQPQLPPWLRVEVDWRVVVFLIALVALCGLLAGVLPAVRGADADLRDRLAGSTRRLLPRRHAFGRAACAVIQVAVALALVAQALVIAHAAWRLRSAPLGFDTQSLVTWRVDPPNGRYPDIGHAAVFYAQAIEEVGRVPGVRGVATNQNLPIAGLPDEVSRTIAVDGQPDWQAAERPLINIQPINSAYFDVMRVPLVRGRAFTADDREQTARVAVVSERLASRAWPGADPIGRRVRIEGTTSRFVPGAAAAEALETPWLTVVGVAGDVRHDGLVNPPGFDLYVPFTQYYAGDTYFIVRTDLPAAQLAASIESAIRRVDREQSVFAIRPFSAYVDDVSWQQRLSVRLLGLFAILTLALATTGTYALMSHLVGERRHELAVRSALGADRVSLVRLVLWRAAALTGCGCAIGLVVAIGLTRWMSVVVAGADRDTAAVIGGAALVIAVCAVVASSIPAQRAAAADPRSVL